MNNTFLNITTLLVKFEIRLNALIIFFAMLLTFLSCGTPPIPNNPTPPTLNSEERQWMEKLFVDLMLEEYGAYTLWGSKPMTRISVCYYTDEQMKAFYEGLSEEAKKEAIFDYRPYDLPENWGKWEKIRSAFPIHKFLLFIKPGPVVPDEPNFADIYFINILESALLIQKHYDLFREKLGRNFDPLEAVLEAENNASEFWQTVNNDSVLFGLLCGFGERNSLCFHWKYREQSDRSKDFTKTLEPHSSTEQDCFIRTLSNFSIPIFASYSEKGEDPVIKKYEDERERIRKIYQGRDFLDLTLQQLTSE